VLERVLLEEFGEARRDLGRDFGRAARTGAIAEAQDPFGGKALHPFAERRIGEAEGRGGAGNGLPSDDRVDGLHAAEDARLLGLREERT
jgi:hypothetical protein